MAHYIKCDWCGKRFDDETGWTAGPRWNKRYYCSKQCCIEGEDNLTDDEIREDNLSFGARLIRGIKNLIIRILLTILVLILLGILLKVTGQI